MKLLHIPIPPVTLFLPSLLCSHLIPSLLLPSPDQQPSSKPEPPSVEPIREPVLVSVQSSNRAIPTSESIWGSFDSAISPNRPSTSHHAPAPFTSPTTNLPQSQPQRSQPSFSFFSPPPHSANPFQQLPQQFRKSGQYGALELNDEPEDEEDDVSSYHTRTQLSNRSTSSSEFNSHTQQHTQEVLFHAQTNEVEEAKRKAKEAMQHRINQRLHHH
jgi:hypothetical protein